MDYKATLRLPRTDFPMKADLPRREPEILAYWASIGLERLVEEVTRDREPFVLHDGPPYANGDIHMGTALNKVLKDVVNKFRTMAGFRTPYVPGWDTHGLPIERKVIEEHDLDRRATDPLVLRRLCRDFALRYIDTMTRQFRRLGVRGDWERPYVTLDPRYEAEEIRVFGEMYRRGLLYKGFRSVNWCPSCETALAEAEIEYEEHRSESLYVAFPLVTPAEGLADTLRPGDRLLAWTTTPWTLPANEALAVHPDLVYVLVETADGRRAVVAEARLADLARLGLSAGAVIARFRGRELAGATVAHPVFDRAVPVLPAEHVTAEEGTGLVHTAPGHGEEDFELGRRFGLPVTVPVDGRGVFTEEAGPRLAGKGVAEAFPEIRRILAERDRLVAHEPVVHSYPHCWRCHNPILFRATEQWFGSIGRIRAELLAAIAEVEWVPAWGEERMRRMTEEREDWCISRQRVWGLPIPAFYCEDCGDVVVTEATIEHVATLVAERGADVWFERPAEELLPAGFRCPACGGGRFRKETDTLDVWFDSGSSHAAVLRKRPELRWPADLYLEGPDQFRGYFNSSLTTSVAVYGQAPYRAVLCHGFVVDGEGRKMSKSLGNVIRPEELLDRYGADILRLWATSADYKADVRVSEEILQQVADSYRKLRNTLRFLLGNLAGYDPEAPVPFADLEPLDRFILTRFARLAERVREHYERYDLHLVAHHVLEFAVVDLSSFWLDVRKDLLYTGRADGLPRRGAVHTCYLLARGLTGLVAPILTFTAEEVWRHLPHRPDDPPTVQLLAFPTQAERLSPEEVREFERLLEVRDVVLKALEEARARREIGTSLQARVQLAAPPADRALLERHRDLLPTLFIVSQVELADGPALAAAVTRAPGRRCERCWWVLPEVGRDPRYPDLCPRCVDALS